MIRHPPSSPLFPYTTLFRSLRVLGAPVVEPRGLELLVAGQGRNVRQVGPGLEQVRDERAPQVMGREARHAGAAGFSPHDLRRSEEHTSELQSRLHLVCRLLL